MLADGPNVVLIGGPNGAGKTTISRSVLAKTLNVRAFVNADIIAAGLAGFDPERLAFAAGRIMLQRLHELAKARENFAFESTLSSRSFAPWLRQLVSDGYGVHLIFVWLRSPELAIQRVKARVRKGGHAIPDEVVRRRYARAASNFWTLYRPLARAWRVYDNSAPGGPHLVAAGVAAEFEIVRDRNTLDQIQEIARGAQDQASDCD